MLVFMKRIQSFDGLRTIAFAMVFLSHLSARLLPLNYFGIGANGVSIFIILSGFLTAYKHYNKKNQNIIKEGMRIYSIKLKKFYPIHMITFLFALVLQLYWLVKWPSKAGIMLAVLYAIPNVLLIQSFFPVGDIYFSYNSVAWYLSDCLFFYLLSPLLLKLAARQKDKCKITGGGY